MDADPPTLIYDDDCGFCTRAAEWVADHGSIEIVGFSELSDSQIRRLPADWRECAHFIQGAEVVSCGAAMEEAFLHTEDAGTGLVRLARELPGWGRLRERGYRLVADHRNWVGAVLP